MKIEQVDQDCYRALDEAGTILGFALRLANDKWAQFAVDIEARLNGRFDQFGKPKNVLAFIKYRAAHAVV